MNVDTLTVGPFASNCFVITNGTKEALLVDPGDEAARIIDHLRAHSLTVAAILITHGHMDHVSALADVHRAFPAPIAMHPVDEAWAFGEGNQMPPHYDVPTAPANIDRALAEGQEWNDIGLRYRVLELPGHAPGHVGFYFPEQEALFSGDVVFAGSVGRTDLPGGDGRVLTQSLKRVAELPDATRIYCGHGPDTSIANEKKQNPYLSYFVRG
jgi:hydroxyacylglutathione hydrolase